MIPYYPTFNSAYPNYQNNFSQPHNTSQIQWCQGESAAKSFFVSPGTSALLMDSEKNVFYIKSADVSGMPLPLRIFDYTERVAAPNILDQKTTENNIPSMSDYVTHEEFEKRLAEIAPKAAKKGAKETDE